ncbi:MAG: hypothetical protein ACI4FY_01725 [Acetatifactor sp.]
MNFDVFNQIQFSRKATVLENGRSAESKILMSPYDAMTAARTAFEALCKGLIKDDRAIPCPPHLAGMIEKCLEEHIFTDKAAAYAIRDNGNVTVHTKKKIDFHAVNEITIQIATESVKSLYEIMMEVFTDRLEQLPFDPLKIPFGIYEVVRAVPKAENEVVVGKYNYFVRDPQDNYFYFQIYHRNSDVESNNELGARGMVAGKRIKEDKRRRSYLLDEHYPGGKLENSDRDYVAYSVYEDSRLLSEMRSVRFTERQIVQIALDLVNVLIELKRIGQGMHLRNIQPGNVIITPDGENYMAAVVNMETAKIKGYEGTVMNALKPLIDGNPYWPGEVRKRETYDGVPWDKVDLYSIAKIMIYCADPKCLQAEVDEGDLYDLFSDEVVEILSPILFDSLNTLDEMEIVKEKLENVLDQ